MSRVFRAWPLGSPFLHDRMKVAVMGIPCLTPLGPPPPVLLETQVVSTSLRSSSLHHALSHLCITKLGHKKPNPDNALGPKLAT